MITKNCSYCGKEITRSPSKFKGERAFCDRNCQLSTYHGNGNPCWRGGKIITDAGYIRVRMPNHERSVGGYVLEHIIVMEKKIGRKLKKDERIHHINGNGLDNRPENLQLFSSNGDHLSNAIHYSEHYKKRYCECGKPVKGLGYCARHYTQFKRTGKVWDFENKNIQENYRKTCKLCNKETISRGYCNAHYQKFRSRCIRLGIKLNHPQSHKNFID